MEPREWLGWESGAGDMAGVGLGSPDGLASVVHESMRRGRLGLLPVESVERAVSARWAVVLLGDTCSTPPSENQCRIRKRNSEWCWRATALLHRYPLRRTFFQDFLFPFFSKISGHRCVHFDVSAPVLLSGWRDSSDSSVERQEELRAELGKRRCRPDHSRRAKCSWLRKKYGAPK